MAHTQNHVLRHPVIAPGATIGILGGGQLGRMMALAGRPLGYRFVVLDPSPDAPSAAVCDHHIVAPYRDLAGIAKLAKLSDVITYEFENIDALTAQALEQQAFVPQGSALLYTTQHRLREKQTVEAAHLRVAPYRAVHTQDDLQAAAHTYGTCILKTATGGYDGHGQIVMHATTTSIAEAWQAVSAQGGEWLLEAVVDYVCELSVVIARGSDGVVVPFMPAVNVHRQGVLHTSVVTGHHLPPHIIQEAQRVAQTLAHALHVVGLLAVEMFLLSDGTLVVNELAPRPHNSAHFTMDSCNVSQFEQHVRALCGLPLIEPKRFTDVVMVNVLGQHDEAVRRWWLAQGERDVPASTTVKYHTYGKKEVRHGRKMGHLNFLTDDPEAVLTWINTCGLWA